MPASGSSLAFGQPLRAREPHFRSGSPKNHVGLSSQVQLFHEIGAMGFERSATGSSGRRTFQSGFTRQSRWSSRHPAVKTCNRKRDRLPIQPPTRKKPFAMGVHGCTGQPFFPFRRFYRTTWHTIHPAQSARVPGWLRLEPKLIRVENPVGR